MTKLFVDKPKTKTIARFLFAHGAGAPMDSPFMTAIAAGLAENGIVVNRFEFSYMAMRRVDGKRRGPGSATKLLDFFRDVVKENKDELPLFIGGKSMGGRIATMIADEPGIAGIVCLGYPFHPPGKPEKLRTQHLETIAVPTLIIQGERDPFGIPFEVERYKLSKRIKVIWAPDGDHSLRPRKRSGHSEVGNLNLAIDEIFNFISGR